MHKLVVLALATTCWGGRAYSQTISDPRFIVEIVHASGIGMIAFDFVPMAGSGADGFMYVTEKQGRVLVLTPDGSGGYNPPTVFADLRAAVDTTFESGLLGLRLDPDFTTNRTMYLFYTTPTEQRLVRVLADATFLQMAAGSETPILAGLPRNVGFHNAGDIQFHPQDPDHIYLTLGDDGQPANSQDLDLYNGKLLKIRKTDGQGINTNPFWDNNAASVRSRVWAYGLRNPFRFAFHPASPVADVLYISENGNTTDKVSWARRGSNGNWNAMGDPAFLNPPDPGHVVLSTDTPSLMGVAIAEGGPFADPAFPSSSVLYISNWITPLPIGSIRRFRMTGANLDSLVPVSADNGQRFGVGVTGAHLDFGPDGALYATTTEAGPATNGFFLIQRVRFVGGVPPIAQFTSNPSPIQGNAPLQVSFTDGSSDPDGMIVSRLWDFGDGTTSSLTNPTHTYSTPGNYTVTLTVTDDSGLTVMQTAPVTVQGGLTLTLTGNIVDARDLLFNGLAEPARIDLYRLDGTTPVTFAGGTGPQGNGIEIFAGGLINHTVILGVTEPGLVLAIVSQPNFQTARVGFDIPLGATTHTENIDVFLANTALRGRITTTLGDTARTDLGVARTTIGQLYTFAGGRDYDPMSGIALTGIDHRTDSDAQGYYYVPIQSGDGGTTFFLDIVGDVGSQTFVSTNDAILVAEGTAIDRDIVLGLIAGGNTCDDLSGFSVPPGVDYLSQVQPIWDQACTGCHNAGAGNSAGLDLSGNAYSRIVGVQSQQVPGLALVQPGLPNQSFLFEKINCASVQVGTRMPSSALTLNDQAVIESWIAEGALAQPPAPDAGVADSGVHPDAVVPDSGVHPDAVVPDSGIHPDAVVPDSGIHPDAVVPDSGVHPDAVVPDTGVHPDAIVPDSGVHPDAVVPDSGLHPDAVVPDTGVHPDAIVPDSGVHPDAVVPDSGIHPDAVVPDSGVHPDAVVPDSGLHPDAVVPDSGVHPDAIVPDSGLHPDAIVPDSGIHPDAVVPDSGVHPDVVVPDSGVHPDGGTSPDTGPNDSGVLPQVSVTLRGTVFDGRTAAGAGLPIFSRLFLYRLDASTPLPIGGTGVAGNGINVPAGGQFDVTFDVAATVPGIVVSAGEQSGLQPALRGFAIPVGRTSITRNLDFYISDTAIRGRILSVVGGAASVDVGLARGTPDALHAVTGGRDFGPPLFLSGVNHRVDSDELGYYYVPIRRFTGGTDFYLDIVTDTATSQFAAAFTQLFVPVSTLVERNFLLQSRNVTCDDLSSAPAPTNIDYANQIQPIWDQYCVACHNPTSPSWSGLDLTAGSRGRIVSVPSFESPSRSLVEPGLPGQSYLFDKLNCGLSTAGARMPRGSPLTDVMQATIRQWILEGGQGSAGMDAGVADAESVDALPDASAEPNDAGTPAADAGPTDASSTDTGPADTGPADTGPADASVDGDDAQAAPDTGGPHPSDAGQEDATRPTDASPDDARPADSMPNPMQDATARDAQSADVEPDATLVADSGRVSPVPDAGPRAVDDAGDTGQSNPGCACATADVDPRRRGRAHDLLGVVMLVVLTALRRRR